MYKNIIEDLCRPLILYMCEIWSFKVRKIEPNEDKIINDINLMLNKIKEQCYSNPMLAQEFSYIEKTLIFFIDYTIKEGNFSFSKNWKNLSRKYGEFSGDDKFFDILALNLDDPMGSERVDLLYQFMGLGFSGSYKNNIEVIENKMKQCLAKMPSSFDINNVRITPIPQSQDQDIEFKQNKKTKIFIIFYLAMFCVMICSLGFNYYIFDKKVDAISISINSAINEAAKSYKNLVTDMNTAIKE